MPIKWLLVNCDQKKIRHIYVASENLKKSYTFLQEELKLKYFDIKIYAISKFKVFQILQLIYILFFSKVASKHIYIFHEAGWPLLDILIFLVRPTGFFVPRLNLFHFKLTKCNDSILNAFKKIKAPTILLKYLISKFLIYQYYEDGERGSISYILKAKTYPESIRTIYEPPSRLVSGSLSNKKILFLTGTDSANILELRRVYSAICKKALRYNWMITIKDHPNPKFRINLNCDDAKIYDPNFPADLIGDCFELVVGSSSASLAYFENSVSIVYLLDSMPERTKDSKMNFLKNLSQKIQFVKSNEQIDELLNETL